MYDDVAYAQSRLLETFVRDEFGFLFYVTKVYQEDYNNEIICSGLSILDQDSRIICPLKKINLKPPPLGYVNHDNRCSYVSRIPKRDCWRQGIRNRNMNGLMLFNSLFDIGKELTNTTLNIFPSFQESLEKVNSDFLQSAFSSKFCINNKNTILYKDKCVGDVKENKIKFRRNFEYLTESFERVCYAQS